MSDPIPLPVKPTLRIVEGEYPPPDTELVNHLEHLLAQAKKGAVREIAYAVVEYNPTFPVPWYTMIGVVANSSCEIMLLGANSRVAARLNWQLDQNAKTTFIDPPEEPKT